MSYRLFLDDERLPPVGQEDSWVIVRSSQQAIETYRTRGAPWLISFDHDLGGADEASVFVNWMIEYALDALEQGVSKAQAPFPRQYLIHSQNPQGAANIRGKMDGFLKFLSEP